MAAAWLGLRDDANHKVDVILKAYEVLTIRGDEHVHAVNLSGSGYGSVSLP